MYVVTYFKLGIFVVGYNKSLLLFQLLSNYFTCQNLTIYQ